MVPAILKVERNGHDDLITFQVDNPRTESLSTTSA
jgi:hypothetical protein